MLPAHVREQLSTMDLPPMPDQPPTRRPRLPAITPYQLVGRNGRIIAEGPLHVMRALKDQWPRALVRAAQPRTVRY